MKIRTLSILSLAAIVSLTACGGDAEGEGDVTAQDTSVVSGTDTVSQPTVVPTQDTVVQTTTVDTIQGEGQTGDTTTVGDTTTKAP
jgi:hypothetical protein